MSKHTPPPWNYRAGYVSTDVNGDYIVLAELHSRFGSDNFGDEPLMLGPKERSANGHLMAAAPEMYELISDLAQSQFNALEWRISQELKSGHEFASRLYDLRCMALRLLAKIEGGGDG